jgi:tight adherence protein C
MKVIIGFLVFAFVFFIIYKIGMSFSAQDKISKKRVNSLIETDEAFVEIQDNFNHEKSGLAKFLEGFAAPLRGNAIQQEELKFKMYRAGAKSPDASSYYLFFKAYGWIPGTLALVAFYLFSGKFQGGIHYAVILIGLLWWTLLTFGANLWLKNSSQKRQLILGRSFPDSLDLLLVCVESGLALDASLARVCRELKFAHPQITEELNQTRLELTMLNDREKALVNFAKRTDMLAVKSLVAALIQSEKFGTSLVDTLRVLSEDYRNTRMMIAEEKAGKLPAKITTATLPFMLLSLLILIAAPSMIKASEEWGKKDSQQRR